MQAGKVVALVSGGKDSSYAMYLAMQHGYDIVALANLLPPEEHPSDEMDSFMYQTVGHQVVAAYATCMGIPLFRRQIQGSSTSRGLNYSQTAGDEVEDLFQLLAFVKEHLPHITAVCSGAIASDYQRLRVENVCSRLNLMSLAYLWHQPQRQLLRGMIDCQIEAILIKVAAAGLEPEKHLGKSIQHMEPLLCRLAELYGCNVCGEGGEYETLTLDCPLFTRARINLEDWEVIMHENNSVAPVGYLHVKSFKVLPKEGWIGGDLPCDIRVVPSDYVTTRALSQRTPSTGTCGDCAKVEVKVHYHAGTDYVHMTLQAHCMDTARLSSGCTESDTVNALAEMLATAQYVGSQWHPKLLASLAAAFQQRAYAQQKATSAAELLSQGLQLEHALFVHLYLANMGHFAAANSVYCKFFPSRDPPSRACVQVPLPSGSPALCDIILARGSHATSSPDAVPYYPRRVLHVQSISSWAPSCIGPYSQANLYRGLVYMAGQIPLDPANMTLVPGYAAAQTLRALRSCDAVAVGLRANALKAPLSFVVYICASLDEEAKAEVRDTFENVLKNGLPRNSSGPSGIPQPAGLSDGAYQTCYDSDQDELETEEELLDSYLLAPDIKSPIKPNVVYLEVPALPRGSAVEIQPVVVDVEGLAVVRRRSADSRRSHDADPVVSPPYLAQQPLFPPAQSVFATLSSPVVPVFSPTVNPHSTSSAHPFMAEGCSAPNMRLEPLVPQAQSEVPAAVTAVALQAPQLHVPTETSFHSTAKHGPSSAGVASKLTQAQHVRQLGGELQHALNAVEAVPHHLTAHDLQPSLPPFPGTNNSCNPGHRCMLDAVPAHHHASLVSNSEAAFGVVSSPTLSSVQPAVDTLPTNRTGSTGCEVMVTTVCHCNQVLHSIMHVPQAVFTASTRRHLEGRFWRAARSVLAAHGMSLDCLVAARVWYKAADVEFAPEDDVQLEESPTEVANSSIAFDGPQPVVLQNSSSFDSGPGSGGHLMSGSGSWPHSSTFPAGSSLLQGSGVFWHTSSRKSSDNQRARDGEDSFHVTWVPVLDVYTPASNCCAAVLEILATT